MSDLERAKCLLEGHTFAVVRGSSEFVSCERGVKPLLRLLPEDWKGAAAADRVVGKAAAFLYVLLGVSTVYAEVLSAPAEAVLLGHGIAVSCRTHTDAIINRAGTGPCPMESAVRDLTDPQEALAAIRTRLVELSAR